MGNKILGQRIEQRRKQLGLTLDDIAKEIGVAKSTVQRYEKGTIGTIKLPVIEAIARIMDVDPAWIRGETDIMNEVGNLSVGHNIRAYRLQCGLTLEDVAKKIGLSCQTLSRYESGVIENIPSNKIEALAKIFCTTPSILMGWEEKSGAPLLQEELDATTAMGERIKARRKEIGLSAEQVAKQLNVSPSTVYRYESGDIEKMGIDKLIPIASALQCTPAYLIGLATMKPSLCTERALKLAIDFDHLDEHGQRVVLMITKEELSRCRG